MSLKKSALSGVFWTFIQQMSTQGINFLVSIILARLLLPEEFGLIALLSVFMSIGNVLIDSGLSQSLIRTTNADQDDYSTIFYFNVLLGIIMYFIMYFSAPIVSNFYNQPPLTSIIRVYCLAFIIGSFSIIQFTKLTKDMNFKKQMIITLPSLVISSSVAIVMALKGYGVWSLVWNALLKNIILTIQLWVWSPWLPSFKFKKDKIKKHLSFSYKLTIAALLNSFFNDIYTIIIGKFFNPIDVGYYNRSNTLMKMPVMSLGAILNKVTYPLFSKIQDDDEKLKMVYKKVMQMVIFIISPTLLFMAILAEPLFRFLFTEKWLPAVPYFQILTIGGILLPINIYNLNIISVKGRSDLILKLAIIKRITVLIVIAICFQWGIYGLLFGKVFLSVSGLYFNTFYAKRLINYSFWAQIKDILPAILLATCSSFVVYVLDKYIIGLLVGDFLRLIIGGGVGVLSYLIVAHFIKLDAYNEVKLILFKRKQLN